MEKLKAVINTNNIELPFVLVTSQEKALLCTLKEYFSESHHTLLSLWQINQNSLFNMKYDFSMSKEEYGANHSKPETPYLGNLQGLISNKDPYEKSILYIALLIGAIRAIFRSRLTVLEPLD